MEILNEYGTDSFSQWDTNQKLIIKDKGNCNSIHFENNDGKFTYNVEILSADGIDYVQIPNEVLRETYDVVAWGVADLADGRKTKIKKSFRILPRQKPDHDEFTPTEQDTFDGLVDKVNKLNGIKDITSTNLEGNGVKNTITVTLADNNPDTPDVEKVFYVWNGEKGDKGDRGESFKIDISYPSLEAMNADLMNQLVGTVAVIAGSTELEEAGQLYVRGAVEWEYLADLSGKQGIQGPQGPKGDTGDIGPQGDTGPQGPMGEVSKAQLDEALALKADKSDTYTKGDINKLGETFQQSVDNLHAKDLEQDAEIGKKVDSATQSERDKKQDAELERRLTLNKESNGNPVRIDNTIEAPFAEMVIKGKTTQMSTEGKNLLDPKEKKQISVNNIVYFFDNGITFKVGVNYTISLGKAIQQIVVKEKATDKNLAIDYNVKTLSFKLDSATNCFIQFFDGNGLTLINPQLELGSEATPYEPYTGGLPSPSPDYPQEIHSSGESGSIGVNAGGKNLLDPSTRTVGGSLFLFYYRKNGILLPQGTYTTSLNKKREIARTEVRTIEDSPIAVSYKSDILTFTLDKPTNIFIVYRLEGNVTEDILGQLEVGSVATPYEPFKPVQTAIATTPSGLNGIGDVADERNETEGKDIKRWVNSELKGTGWTWELSGNVGRQRFVTEDLLGKVIPTSEDNALPYLFCEYLSRGSNNQTYRHDDFLISINTGGGLAVTYNKFADTSDINGFKAWIDSVKPKICYAIKTPVVTDIPQEEKAQFDLLNTEEGTTTVWSEEPVDFHLAHATDNNVSKALNEKADKDVERGLSLHVDNPIFRVDGNGTPLPPNQIAHIVATKKYIDAPIHWDIEGRTVPDGTEEIDVDINELISEGIELKNITTVNTDDWVQNTAYTSPGDKMDLIANHKYFISLEVTSSTDSIINHGIFGYGTGGYLKAWQIKNTLNNTVRDSQILNTSRSENTVFYIWGEAKESRPSRRHCQIIDITDLSNRYPQYTDEQLKKILDDSLPYISAGQSKTLGGVVTLENLISNSKSVKGWKANSKVENFTSLEPIVSGTFKGAGNASSTNWMFKATNSLIQPKYSYFEKIGSITPSGNSENYMIGANYSVFSTNKNYGYKKYTGSNPVNSFVVSGVGDGVDITLTIDCSKGMCFVDTFTSLLDLQLSLWGLDTDEKKADWCNDHIPPFEGTYDLILNIKNELSVVVRAGSYTASTMIEVVENINSALNLYRAVHEVFEEGPDYIKFRDGTAMCWGEKDVTVACVHSGNIWKANLKLGINFSFPFIKIPKAFVSIVNPSVTTDGWQGWINRTETSLTDAVVYFYDNRSDSLMYFSWFAIGKWK